MRKTETVLLEVFYCKSQLEIAKRLNVSLSTVNNAVRPLVEIGALKILPQGFRVIDKRKALSFFAVNRNLSKGIVYSAFEQKGVSFIEKSMPARVVFGAFSAFKFRYGSVPADYSEVYIYASEKELGEIKKRFPKTGGFSNNLIVLQKPENLRQENQCVPDELMYADLWNLKQWYAAEFLKELEKRMRLGD